MKIISADVTDCSTSFVVAVGKRYKIGGDGQVGDVWGGPMVRNSGVEFASLADDRVSRASRVQKRVMRPDDDMPH